MLALADPELQKRGRWANFCRIQLLFLKIIIFGPNDLFRHFPENLCISQNNFIYLPKFLMTFFNLPFFLRGGLKSLHFINFTILSLFFLSRGGQTPLPTSMGGAMAGFAPWIRHCMLVYSPISAKL